MRHRSVTLAAVLLLSFTSSAAAAGPVLVPGWNVTAPHAETVDNQGRGVAAFARGDYVWLASVAPDGRPVEVSRIEAPRSVDGPSDLGVAMNDRGNVVASYAQFSGRQPVGRDGFGFQIRPFAARFEWGRPPGLGRVLVNGPVNLDIGRPAIGEDGTAAVLFAGESVVTNERVQGAAVLGAAGQAPRIERPLGTRGGPLSVTANNGGGFLAAFNQRGSIVLSRSDAAGRFGPVERPLAGGRPIPAAPVLSDRAGNLLVAWDRRDKQRRGGREILVTERAADARAFTAPRVVARGRDRLVTAAMGAGGAAALLLADGRQAAVLRRLGPRRFVLAPPLPGRTRISLGSRLLAVDASGGALVSYRVELGARTSAARTVRLGADGSVRYTDARDCDPLGLAGAASGAALLTLACPRNADGDGDGDIDAIGGAVQTFSPQEP